MSRKKEHLIEVAERLFSHEGFHATTLDRVIVEAGIARMTLYNHFRSKDDLILAVIQRYHQSYYSMLVAAVETAVAMGQSRILSIFNAHEAWMKGKGDHGCLLMRAVGEYTVNSVHIAKVAIAAKLSSLAFIRAQLQADGVPEQGHLAEQIFMLMEGATALAQILPPAQMAELGRAAIQRFIETQKKGPVRGRQGTTTPSFSRLPPSRRT